MPPVGARDADDGSAAAFSDVCLLYRLSFEGRVSNGDLYRLQRFPGRAFGSHRFWPVCTSPLHVSPRQAVIYAEQIQAVPDNGQGGLYLRLDNLGRTDLTQLRVVAMLVHPHQDR